jgi:hypothetical protein
MTDESQRDELKFGLGGLLDRGALNRLQAEQRQESTQAEGSVTDALYPTRRLRSAPHDAAPAPLPAGVDLALLPDAIRAAAWLPANERMRLLANVRALAAFVEQSRAASSRPLGGTETAARPQQHEPGRDGEQREGQADLYR